MCLQNVDQNELSRQLQKPHGALEISDLDLSFTEGDVRKFLCMPFKTGREITKSSVAVEYFYQIIRPFAHFGSQCFVVFVTAKRCSQALETLIQQMSIQLPSWRIDIIQEQQLIQLLKANNQFDAQQT
jgi:hypothetical protein